MRCRRIMTMDAPREAAPKAVPLSNTPNFQSSYSNLWMLLGHCELHCAIMRMMLKKTLACVWRTWIFPDIHKMLFSSLYCFYSIIMHGTAKIFLFSNLTTFFNVLFLKSQLQEYAIASIHCCSRGQRNVRVQRASKTSVEVVTGQPYIHHFFSSDFIL